MGALRSLQKCDANFQGIWVSELKMEILWFCFFVIDLLARCVKSSSVSGHFEIIKVYILNINLVLWEVFGLFLDYWHYVQPSRQQVVRDESFKEVLIGRHIKPQRHRFIFNRISGDLLVLNFWLTSDSQILWLAYKRIYSQSGDKGAW